RWVLDCPLEGNETPSSRNAIDTHTEDRGSVRGYRGGEVAPSLRRWREDREGAGPVKNDANKAEVDVGGRTDDHISVVRDAAEAEPNDLRRGPRGRNANGRRWGRDCLEC